MFSVLEPAGLPALLLMIVCGYEMYRRLKAEGLWRVTLRENIDLLPIALILLAVVSINDAWDDGWRVLGYCVVVTVSWALIKGIIVAFLRGAEPKPEPAPLTERWVQVNAEHSEELPGGNIRIVGAAVATGVARGSCGVQPREYVMDRGGFIVTSPDPSVHPGAIPACAKPANHKGLHTWQAPTECGHNRCSNVATVRYRYRVPSSVGFIWEDVCDEHEDDFRQHAEAHGIKVTDQDRERLMPLERV